MKNLIFIIIILIGLTSCNRKIASKTTTTDTISLVSTTISYRDTTIYVPGDTVEVSISSPCDSLGRLIEGYKKQVKNTKGSATLEVKNNELVLRSQCDSLSIELQNTIIQRDSLLKITSNTTETKIDKKVPLFFWITTSILGGLILSLIGYVLIKLKIF